MNPELDSNSPSFGSRDYHDPLRGTTSAELFRQAEERRALEEAAERREQERRDALARERDEAEDRKRAAVASLETRFAAIEYDTFEFSVEVPFVDRLVGRAVLANPDALPIDSSDLALATLLRLEFECRRFILEDPPADADLAVELAELEVRIFAALRDRALVVAGLGENLRRLHALER
jgi:hypothetical protein